MGNPCHFSAFFLPRTGLRSVWSNPGFARFGPRSMPLPEFDLRSRLVRSGPGLVYTPNSGYWYLTNSSAMTFPRICLSLKSSSNCCNFILKTRVIRSGRSFERWLSNSSLAIPGQFRLHVNVTKKSRGSIARQIAIAS